MVDVAQLVRVVDCGSIGRGFESHLPPKKEDYSSFLFLYPIVCEVAEIYNQMPCIFRKGC